MWNSVLRARVTVGRSLPLLEYLYGWYCNHYIPFKPRILPGKGAMLNDATFPVGLGPLGGGYLVPKSRKAVAARSLGPNQIRTIDTCDTPVQLANAGGHESC